MVQYYPFDFNQLMLLIQNYKLDNDVVVDQNIQHSFDTDAWFTHGL